MMASDVLHTETELRKLASIIAYEREMLQRTHDMAIEDWCNLFRCPEQGYEILDSTEDPETGMGCSGWRSDKGNAFLESFLVHARVLKDFLWKDGSGHKDDVFAWEYVGRKNGWGRPDMGKYLTDNKNRLDKSLAHLSVARLSFVGKKKEWDLPRVRDEIQECWEAFLNALDTERRLWFEFRPTFVG